MSRKGPLADLPGRLIASSYGPKSEPLTVPGQQRQRKTGVTVAHSRVSVAEVLKTSGWIDPEPGAYPDFRVQVALLRAFQFSRDTQRYAFVPRPIE